MANDGVSKGSEEAVAELAASVADEAVAELADDKSLLKGRVPQVDNWVDAWAESTEQVSFRKQARIWSKKECARARNLRQIRRKQLEIIAEVRRQDIREQLRRATDIGLSMDERRYLKVVRYRCDAPTKPFVHRGVLGVLSLEKSALGDFEEDHAVIAVRKMDLFLTKFCTPPHPSPPNVGRWRRSTSKPMH